MKKKKEKDPNRLGFGTLLKFKSSDVAQSGIQTIVVGFLTVYCTDTMGMNPAMVGVLLMVSKIVDAVTDVFAGWLVDNTHTRFGKGRPYDLCIVGTTLCSVLLFSGNPAWSGALKNIWIFLMYTLVFSVFTTLRGAASTPYTIRIFHNNETLIRKVASYGGIITMLGAIIVNMLFPIVMTRYATSAAGWRKTILIFAIPLTFLGVIRFFTLKEDPAVDAGNEYKKVSPKEIFLMFRKNPYVWLYALMMLAYNVTTATGISTYYYKYIIGNTALMSVTSALTIIILPIMLTFPVIMKKLGSMSRMVFWFSIIGMGGYLLLFFAKASLPLLIIGTTVGGLASMPLA
ncbi:MAG: MFS transporter, partial [Lachnospiraceae bacterium]